MPSFARRRSLLGDSLSQLLVIQAVLAVSVAIMVSLCGTGVPGALSALLGGSVAGSGAVAFALGVWVLGGPKDPSVARITCALAVAEMFRITTTICLLTVAFGMIENLSPLPFLGGFSAALLAHGFMLLIPGN